MLVQGWSCRQHEPGRRSRPGWRSRPGGEGWHEYLRSRWPVAQGGMRPDCIVMPSPALDDDHLRDPNRADRVRNWGSLRDQDVHLAQLGNDLFGSVSLLAHRDPPWLKSHPSGWTTPKGADHGARWQGRRPQSMLSRVSLRMIFRLTLRMFPGAIQSY